MKRTPLVRRTPLARGAPLARTAMKSKPKPRPPDDRVTPELHAEVVARDGMCFGAMAYAEQVILEGSRFSPAAPWMTEDIGRIETHLCRDSFGNDHLATARNRLTVDHFHHHVGGTKGDRAPSDRRHLVAMCHWLNTRPPPAAIREAERAYMKHLIETGRA